MTLREVEEKRKLPASQLMAREGELLIAAAPAGATLVALDRSGKAYDSRSFAHRLEQWRNESVTDVAFLIGGADGHTEALLARAPFSLSFWPMTWPLLVSRAA